MDLSRIKNIYMVGIKGVGMAMLAQYLKSKGFVVSGSDTKEKFMTDKVLIEHEIPFKEGFSAANIPDQCDLYIYSTAYNQDTNEEVRALMGRKKQVLTYGQALAEIFNSRYGLAVAGTHGKTTTSAWLGFVLKKCGLDPSAMIGAYVPQFEGMALIGLSDLLIIEADEYQRKLDMFNPKMAIITNVDYDHPDSFPIKEDYDSVFIDFMKKLPKKGFLVVNYDDPVLRRTARVNTRAKLRSFAINENADYVAYNIKAKEGRQYFKVKFGVGEDDNGIDPSENELGDFSIQLAGRHNISNALAVIAAAIELEVDLSLLRQSLGEFIGTARRMERLGSYRGALIVDDYAHHPTEIRATIQAARELFGNKKIRVVFHPHTFTRTKALFSDFESCFTGVDELMVLDIYGSAREVQGGVSSAELAAGIKRKLGEEKVKYTPTLESCEAYLRDTVSGSDVILLMGAGDVFRIGKRLLGE